MIPPPRTHKAYSNAFPCSRACAPKNQQARRCWMEPSSSGLVDRRTHMPGGCWICNPMCGKCQPAPKKSGTCPDCGTCTIFDRVDIVNGVDLHCKKCGKDMNDLVRPQPVRCNYSGLICAYPCGKSSSPRHDHGNQPCKRNTPPSKEWLDAHPA